MSVTTYSIHFSFLRTLERSPDVKADTTTSEDSQETENDREEARREFPLHSHPRCVFFLVVQTMRVRVTLWILLQSHKKSSCRCHILAGGGESRVVGRRRRRGRGRGEGSRLFLLENLTSLPQSQKHARSQTCTWQVDLRGRRGVKEGNWSVDSAKIKRRRWTVIIGADAPQDGGFVLSRFGSSDEEKNKEYVGVDCEKTRQCFCDGDGCVHDNCDALLTDGLETSVATAVEGSRLVGRSGWIMQHGR